MTNMAILGSGVILWAQQGFGNDSAALLGLGVVSEKQPDASPALPALPALPAFQCHQHHQNPSAAGGTMTPQGRETRNGRSLSGEGSQSENWTFCKEGVFPIRRKRAICKIIHVWLLTKVTSSIEKKPRQLTLRK